MSKITFSTTLYSIKDWLIAPLPEEASKQLPSRGQVAVIGTVNTHEFRTVLEPDGNFGHWINVSDELKKALNVQSGDTIAVELEVTKAWPEPTVPNDFNSALKVASAKVQDKWHDITPMARWEWIRWVNSTARDETRAIRIEKSISKLEGKHRRPCCFNLAACTVPEVAKSGVLITSANAHSV